MVTPNQKAPTLSKKVGATVVLKREDMHPLGSHKGRSIPNMIEHYAAEGAHTFAISSSGNAALAAIRYCTVRPTLKPGSSPLNLSVYIGTRVNKKKQALLEKESSHNARITIHQVERPLQSLLTAVKAGAVALRQSTDNHALNGYEALAQELSHIQDLQAVFIGTSSGTTAEALGNYFLERDLPVQIHIVQTPDCHPIFDTVNAESAQSTQTNSEPSIADAIVDSIGHRKGNVATIIKDTAGSATIVTNEEITEAQLLVTACENIDISPNSALSIAGLLKRQKAGQTWQGSVVCLICGL